MSSTGQAFMSGWKFALRKLVSGPLSTIWHPKQPCTYFFSLKDSGPSAFYFSLPSLFLKHSWRKALLWRKQSCYEVLQLVAEASLCLCMTHAFSWQLLSYLLGLIDKIMFLLLCALQINPSLRESSWLYFVQHPQYQDTTKHVQFQKWLSLLKMWDADRRQLDFD